MVGYLNGATGSPAASYMFMAGGLLPVGHSDDHRARAFRQRAKREAPLARRVARKTAQTPPIHSRNLNAHARFVRLVRLWQTEMATLITDVKVILTAPEGINLIVVKVETNQPGFTASDARRSRTGMSR